MLLRMLMCSSSKPMDILAFVMVFPNGKIFQKSCTKYKMLIARKPCERLRNARTILALDG